MTVGWQRQGFAGQDPAEHPAARALAEGLPGAVRGTGIFRGQAWAELHALRVPEALLLLRDHPVLRYDYLTDLCALHRPDRAEAPLEVVYQLFSLSRGERFRLKTAVAEGASVPTAIPVYPAADWMEREAFDLVGVRFAGHPHLTRILNPEGFDGHPLRRDFPVRGKVTW